ncbi:cAMP receptor-like protein [Tieghemostelium lacteum]|uniref:cAMP receptor-like protein n=1 Tax=Tieghemostelium lacteum TaxID=361077 RepID=A0A152A226_TIELA|nr:cAMP receptor-like protein [Tieghemostelium lacteum]|eukprot:KYR00303.1 cAMP receptor-like protein [Tieghemostelium lacteum]
MTLLLFNRSSTKHDYDSSDSSLVFSKEHIDNLDKIVYFSSGLGIIGALFIILSYLIFRSSRNFSTRLIMFLSLSDLMSAISYLPFGRESKALCDLQGMGLVFFLSSSYFWTMTISISLFLVFFTEKYELNYLMKYFHAICWGIPMFSTLVSLIFNAYGLTGSWCFIEDPTSFFRLFYYLPLIVVFLINLSVFVAIRWKISKHSNSMVAKVNIVVSFYLIAFALSQLPTIINSIQNFIYPTQPIYGLFAAQLFLQPLQGFLNFIVYGYNEGFINNYIEFIEKYLCRCRKSRELKQIDVNSGLLVDYDNSDDDETPTNRIDQLIIDDYSNSSLLLIN